MAAIWKGAIALGLVNVPVELRKSVQDNRISFRIAYFVDLNEIDPRFYEKSYFIVPAKGGGRAFALLRDAMRHTHSAGIGKIIMHRRQHLVVIRPSGNALVLLLMRFTAKEPAGRKRSERSGTSRRRKSA